MKIKYLFFTALASTLLWTSCATVKPNQNMKNPLLESFQTPFGVPPFEQIQIKHFQPAFESAFQAQNQEISAIVQNEDTPTFENTIAALDYSGRTLTQVARVFYNFLSANTSKDLQDLAVQISPAITQHSDNIYLNEKLFEKVKAVYNQKDELSLDTEQQILLDKTYKGFVRGGADLPTQDKDRFRAINERLSVLTLQFGNHVLAEINDFTLIVDNQEDLAGLPENMIQQAAAEAQKRGLENQWVFTIHVPVYEPFMSNAENRELRKKMYTAYTEKANQNNEHDNKAIIQEIVSLRAEKAQLLGYDNHAQYVLEEAMSKTPEQVNERLASLWKAAQRVVSKEQDELQKIAQQEQGDDFQLEPWDWAYYAEKLKTVQYEFNEDAFRPYLSLEGVQEGVFLACKKLFGLEFKKREDVPVYHEDALAYEVLEADGTSIGILYMDFFTRASKRGGAWMTSYRTQYTEPNGQHVQPIITIVFNFTKPSEGTPALLNIDEMSTFYHEFGHALHGLLSQVKYPKLSGTNVPRDFVEFPSQFFENWGMHPEFMKVYAKHYQTGEAIPDSLIQKYEKAQQFNQGFRTTEYLAAAILDMSYHTLSADQPVLDVSQFEHDAMQAINLTDAIPPRYRSTYYSHIFSGGYSAGYYSYIWSEMLDADAFELFEEKGIFDPQTAQSYRKNILEKGGTDDPMKLYIQFRGSEPKMDALIQKRGLAEN